MFNFLMNNTEMIESFLTPILAAVGTALAGAVTFGITRLIAWINRKIGNDKLAQAIERLGDIVNAAVQTTNQTFVDQLKKDGKFDPEAQKQAFERTLAIVNDLLTEEVKDILKEAFGDLSKYIEVTIEKVVSNSFSF